MRINEYDSFDDFYYEYAYGKAFSWQDPNKRERFCGIEFKYKGNYFRMCNEPLPDSKLPTLPDGRKGHYSVYKLVCEKKQYPASDDYIEIGWYANLDELLEKCTLPDGTPFREAIMADDTQILSKD